MYVTVCMRIDIARAVGVMSRLIYAPEKEH